MMLAWIGLEGFYTDPFTAKMISHPTPLHTGGWKRSDRFDISLTYEKDQGLQRILILIILYILGQQ